MRSILFQLGYGDERYLPMLKPILIGRCKLHLTNVAPTAILEVAATAKQKGCTAVATTNPKLLQMLLNKTGESLPSLDDYAGSIIDRYGIEFLILNPVEHLATVPYGRFLYERYFKKLLHPEDWLEIPPFSWELFQPSMFDEVLEDFRGSTYISIDIETASDDDRRITCVGFTAVYFDIGQRTFRTRTIVVPFLDSYSVEFTRRICGLHIPKLFQNGKYDNSYLLRYGIVVNCWSYDTAHMFHAWYSELPKRLDFIVSFTLRKWQYWKDESKSQDIMEYYQYNAKDAFTTAMSWLALMTEVPPWAMANYRMEFPLVFPCITAEMTGIKADKEMFALEEERFTRSLEKQLTKLGQMVACSAFNPSSPQQVMKVFSLLGSGDLKNTTPPSMDKCATRHPLNKRIIDAIKKFRKDRKLITSYLRDFNPKTKRFHTWNGRIFFALNPHGTDTGRLASKESHFWCGLQIQNIPRDRKDIQIKKGFIADENFLFGECDYEQAEARDTAYLSGDTNLIAAVESTNDFHSVNASKFFGLAYERIFDNNTGEVIDKDIRDLSKRTNHGSNYNMGAGVMLDTMGIANVIRARQLLNLPSRYSLVQVTQSLLNTYAATYPVVKGPWYDKVKNDVDSSHFLVGPTGWTRYCFGHPSDNKRDLNAYVAHPPQSLNAMTLNKAYLKVFYEVYLPNIGNFKLGPQIHDSILFQYREGYEHLAYEVKRCMEMKIPVTDTFGITRDLFVPVALKGGARRWSDIEKLK